MSPLLVCVVSTAIAMFTVTLALLLLLWRQAFAETKKAFSKPLGRSWAAERPAFSPSVAVLDAAWKKLGYVYSGILLAAENPNLCFVIYTHPEHPIFASTLWLKAGGRDFAHPTLLTFFEDRGKLTTTSTAGVGANVAGLFRDGSRLVQFRPNATPEALDYQHRKALADWITHGRQPRPAVAEAIIQYSLEDHEVLRPAVEVAGWLPFWTFLGIATGNPRGVARF